MLFYNGPIEGNQSTVDKAQESRQLKLEMAIAKALREDREATPLTDLANSINIPKHTGKQVVRDQYIPILDDRNISDEGIDADGVTKVSGNMYGSSKDIGTISSRTPHLTEKGGRVNGVSLSRRKITGSITRQGFFMEFSDEALDFDSDSELYTHITREMLNAAHKIYEDMLQIDILNAATTRLYAGGVATSMAELKGEASQVAGIDKEPDLLTYNDFVRLEEILTEKKATKTTKILTGSTNIDTRTVGSMRLLLVGSPIKRILANLKDNFGNPAFIPIQQYASQTTPLENEIGAIGSFRVIEIHDFKYYGGQGAEVTNNEGYRTTTIEGKEHYDVYPLLCVPSDTFSTIQFRSSTGKPKFNMIVQKPGPSAASYNNPFGTLGYVSLQWWYGTVVYYPEKIGVMLTVAPL